MKHLLLVTFIAATAGLSSGQAPDNTKTNQRDRSDRAITADQQFKMSKGDTDVLKQIRRSVYADKTLSTYAHNVKIIVQDGNVTLRGPVRTQGEKDEIQRKATNIAGVTNVTNELDLVPSKKTKGDIK